VRGEDQCFEGERVEWSRPVRVMVRVTLGRRLSGRPHEGDRSFVTGICLSVCGVCAGTSRLRGCLDCTPIVSVLSTFAWRPPFGG